MNAILKKRFLPLFLTLTIIILDQISKWLVVRFITVHECAISIGNGFFRIIHEKNLGAAFSMGDSLGPILRTLFIIIIPSLAIIGMIAVYLFYRDITLLQLWALAGIIGGGVGNMVDRISRPDGVVDFISVRLYGFLGMQYFPTFNIADSAVSVCGALFLISLLIKPETPHTAGLQEK